MIYVLLAQGFEEIEALTPVDMLRRAGLKVQTVGVTGEYVTGSHGITVKADISPEKMTEKMDMLILPGGMPGTTNLDAWPQMDALLDRAGREGARIAAICAAPMILGKRGLLKGRYALCFPGFEKYLLGANSCVGRVITDGPYTTSLGMGSSLEFAAELVSCLAGIDVAAELYTTVHGK